MKPMTSGKHGVAYRPSPAVFSALGAAAEQSGSEGLGRTAADSAGPVHHENLTTSAASRELLARAVTIPMERYPRAGESLVYFVECGGMVKVGTTKNLKARISQLRSALPLPVRVIGFGPGDMKREQALHALLKAEHSHGEWFRPSAALLRWVPLAQGDAFEWQRLPPWKEPEPLGPLTKAQHREREAYRQQLERRFNGAPMIRWLRAQGRKGAA